MTTVQSISVPGCVECKKFEEWWKTIATDFSDIEYQNIDATTPEGQALVLEHQIFSSPGIIINGKLFSTGGVNKDKFLEHLRGLEKDNL